MRAVVKADLASVIVDTLRSATAQGAGVLDRFVSGFVFARRAEFSPLQLRKTARGEEFNNLEQFPPILLLLSRNTLLPRIGGVEPRALAQL